MHKHVVLGPFEYVHEVNFSGNVYLRTRESCCREQASSQPYASCFHAYIPAFEGNTTQEPLSRRRMQRLVVTSDGLEQACSHTGELFTHAFSSR